MTTRGEALRPLLDEHRTVRRVLDALEAEAPRSGGGSADLPFDLWEEIVGFFRDYYEGQHSKKEEDVLFPALVVAGARDRAGTIGLFRAEHEDGRELLARFAEAVAARDTTATRAAMRSYARHVREHLAREENLLYPPAVRLLGDAAMLAIRRGFSRIDRESQFPAIRVDALLARMLGHAAS